MRMTEHGMMNLWKLLLYRNLNYIVGKMLSCFWQSGLRHFLHRHHQTIYLYNIVLCMFAKFYRGFNQIVTKSYLDNRWWLRRESGWIPMGRCRTLVQPRVPSQLGSPSSSRRCLLLTKCSWERYDEEGLKGWSHLKYLCIKE